MVCQSNYSNVAIQIQMQVTQIHKLEVCLLTLIIPGQLGPMSRVVFWRRSLCLTLTMSCWGIPSVMHTTRGTSASMASMMAAAAKGGGT